MRTIPFGKPMIGPDEKRAVMEVLDGPTLTHGPKVRQFEEEFARFTGAEHAVAVASCTAAMHLAYMYLGLGPGDEVIVPAQTHVATAHAVELCGATCVFVDAEPEAGNVDIDQIEARITGRTKAVAVMHYLGMPVEMDRVRTIADRHNLFVVEDCALSLGSYYRGTHTGLWGDVGCFSFYPVKHITTAEGGMLICRRRDVAQRVAQLRAFGIDRNVVGERDLPGMYDVPMLGLNYRLNEIAAALGLVQLKRLPEFLQTRRGNFRALAEGLAGIEGVDVLGTSRPVEHESSRATMRDELDGPRRLGFRCTTRAEARGSSPAWERGRSTSGCYCLAMMLDEGLRSRRVELIHLLQARGVGTSIYYPQPVPRLRYYREKYKTREWDYPVAARISDASLALPVGPHLAPADIDYMVGSIVAAIEEIR